MLVRASGKLWVKLYEITSTVCCYPEAVLSTLLCQQWINWLCVTGVTHSDKPTPTDRHGIFQLIVLLVTAGKFTVFTLSAPISAIFGSKQLISAKCLINPLYTPLSAPSRQTKPAISW